MAGKTGRRVGLLTAREVTTIKKPGLHGDGGNLFLKVDLGGSKSWVFRHQLAGKVRSYGLGPVHAISLSDARDQAEEVRKQLALGIDPKQARRARLEAAALEAARSVSFDQARDEFIEAHKAGWRNDKHRKQWTATLKRYATPVIGRLPVSTVNTEHVHKILSPIWATKNETASRVRGRIEVILAYAKTRMWRDGENPAMWRGHLDQLFPKRKKVRRVKHHPALPYQQLPSFTGQLRQRDAVAARALEFAILTATRTSETLNAVWGEFDLANRVWIIPAERMKAERDHKVPLSDRAVTILQEMQAAKRTAFIFPGAKPRRPLSNMALLILLRRMRHENITTHGFRSSFRVWTAECTSFQREVAEMALAHVVGNETEQAYQRSDLFDKRRTLMDSWATYCEPRATSGKVVAIR
jgi:integrase